jgi:transcriptional regulator with XRE-family HTH domain
MLHKMIKEIRMNKGLSQKEVAEGYLSQSNYSKYENGIIDLPIKTFIGILNNLNMSLEEVLYISNGYNYSEKENIYRDFFRLPINNLLSLEQFILRCNEYLQKQQDPFILYLHDISITLKDAIKHHDIYYAKNIASNLLKQFYEKNTLYEKDIYLINSIFFLFPLNTARLTMEYIESIIEKYGEFNTLYRIFVNLRMNYSLMLIKEKYYKEALAILEKTLPLTKKYKLIAQMGVLYIRIGICQANLAIETETDYLVKGLTILDVIEEHDLLEIMQVEVKKYSKSTEKIGV